MSDDKLPVPAGWYPDPEGGRRYWDGTQWLNLPAPGPHHNPGEPATTGRRKRFLRKPLLWTLVILVLVCGGATLAWKLPHDAQITAQEEAAKKEAERLAADKAAQEARDTTERTKRGLYVVEIENSVQTMAEGHVDKGMLDGPVLSVSCSPVNGGSTDNLTETTTVFECFVANEDNGDGTMSGYKYHATMNWSSGS